MGTLADQIAASRQKRGTRCTFCDLFASLDDEDRAVILDVMADYPATPQSQLARGLQASGYDVSKDTLGRHYRGDCRTWAQVSSRG